MYSQTVEGSRDRELLEDVWGWRELLQRAIDGQDTSDDASAAGLAEYEELPGAWPPVTGGYQVFPCTNAAIDKIDVTILKSLIKSSTVV